MKIAYVMNENNVRYFCILYYFLEEMIWIIVANNGRMKKGKYLCRRIKRFKESKMKRDKIFLKNSQCH